MLFNSVLAIKDSFQNTVQIKLKEIDIELGIYRVIHDKDSLLNDLDQLVSEVRSVSNISKSTIGGILDLSSKTIIGIIIFILIALIMSEAKRLLNLENSSKRLFVVNSLIEEYTSQNSNWQLWK